MSQAGLAFEQAPPFALPLRFFLTAPLFLLAAGILITLYPEALASRWTPQAVTLTHAFTLGFLALVMLGALLQMLPVVAGAPLPAAHVVARVSHVALTLGTAALMAGFLDAGPLYYGLGMMLLGSGFAVFLVAAVLGLARAAAGVTVNGMRFAVAALALTVVLGLALVLPRTGWWVPPGLAAASAAHVGFGLAGWVLLLVIGVAYQVVPMFQLTPPYPPRLSRWLAGALFALLLLHAAAPWLPPFAARLVDAALAAGVVLFAVATLRLQARRRRKLPDVTLDYWRLGMASLVACVAIWGTAQFWPAFARSDVYPVLLGVLFLGGFASSVVIGMLYKIVPFLAWFHLQAQLQARAGSIPTMKEMIAEPLTRWHFRLHLLASMLLATGIAMPYLTSLTRAAGILLALSGLLLGFNLLSAARRFSRHGGRFSQA